MFDPIMRDPAVAPLERIRNSLNLFVEMTRAQQNGCLICHVAVEHVSDDPTVDAAVTGYFEQIQEMLLIPLREAAAAGSLNPNLTPEDAAQLVFDAKMSMGIYARAAVAPAVFERIVNATMAALRAPAGRAA